MNLVIIAAVIAVASAAKLDRTYLPPPSAKTAGGSPGALQTPFASNSFNYGLGGIPKGGFENDFKGVVVDAAAPGTRASADGETGLGAPRIAYGSTNSKVGEAAFRGPAAGFRGFPQQNQIENQQNQFPNQQNQILDGATAGTSLNAQSFVQGPGNFQDSSELNYQRSQELIARDAAASIVGFDSDVGTDSFRYSFETDNGISAEESGIATNGVQAQGGFSYTGDDGQVYSVTYTADEGGYQPKGEHLPTPPPIPEEILKSLEQNAREEAAGIVDDGSYDAQKYNAEGDYTENDGASTHNGRQPAQFGNRPESDASASGTFINQSNLPLVRPNSQAGPTGQTNTGLTNFRSSSQGLNGFGQTSSSSNLPNGFGQSVSNKPNAYGQPASSSNASNGFGQSTSSSNGGNDFAQIASNKTNTFSQTASPSNAPNGFVQYTSSSNPENDFAQSVSNKPNTFSQTASPSNAANVFGQSTSSSNDGNVFAHSVSNKPNIFGQTASTSNVPNTFGHPKSAPHGFSHTESAAPNDFAQAAASSNRVNGFGQTNHAITGSQQNKPSFNTGVEDSENANTFISPTFESSQNIIQGQDKPQQSSFRGPQSDSQAISGQSTSGPLNDKHSFEPTPNNGNTFGQRQLSSQTRNRFGSNEYLPPVNGNRRPTQSNAQRPSSFGATQNFNQFSQSTNKPEDSGVSSIVSSSQSSVESQRPQFGSFQNNQFTDKQKPTKLPTSQSFTTAETNEKPSFGGSQNMPTLDQASHSFSSIKQSQSTVEPVTELTTPFEDSSHSNSNSQLSAFGSFDAQFGQKHPTQSPLGSQPKGAPQFNAPDSTSTSAFSSSATFGFQESSFAPSSLSNQRPQSSSQYHQENNFGQSQSTGAFSLNRPGDIQFASSTKRPIFAQNSQTQGSDDSYYYNQPSKAFNAPYSLAQGSRFSNTPLNKFDRVTQRPSLQTNGQATVSQQNFPGSSFSQKGQPQGSTRYPRPPTLSSVAPTSPTRGSTTASFNGITQASVSAFTSGAPTSSTPFGSQNTFSSFGKRPTQPLNSQFNNQGFGQSTSNQQTLSTQSTVNPQSFSNRNQQQNNVQNQQVPNPNDFPAALSQQYQGEIYEYTKPAQTLPPPTEEDKKEGFGQFGNPAKFQPGQQVKAQESSDSQSGQSQGRPQFAAQPIRPQFGQKTQTSQQSQFNAQVNSRPQFGQQTTPFGSAQTTQASAFAQTLDVQKPQSSSGNQLNVQANLNAGTESGQKFSLRPSGQASQINSQLQQLASQELRPTRPCCKNLPSAPQIQLQSNQFGGQSQGQFGSSDVTAQDFKLNQDSAQSLAGKGEVFGGPRKPPSFDEQTGYHY